MKREIIIVYVLLNMVLSAGCANSQDDNTGAKPVTSSSISRNQPTSDHFNSHFQDAGKFLDLKHLGDKHRERGDYENAIAAYEKALNDHAYSRPEQAIASSRIAQTYELAQKYELAATYYEIAAKATMNSDQATAYTGKADALR